MTNWISKAVNYQINFRSLAAREPRNAFEAIDELNSPANTLSPISYATLHLEKLRQLGVTLLHLMPPFVMGQECRKGIGSPYAVKDYFTIESELGTREELGNFVCEAHRLNFRIILGMVPNHTSRDNVWVSDHPEYYVQNEAGVPAFDLDWSDTAKLNYQDPGLRMAMKEVYDYWLSFLKDDGVDGFRIDMAHFINDRSFWNDTLPLLKEKYADRSPLFLAECYGIDNNLDLFARGMNGAYDDELYKVCEVFYVLGAEGQTRLNDTLLPGDEDRFSDHYQAFRENGIRGAVERILKAYANELSHFSDPIYLARYTDNHDEGRGVYRFGEGGVRAFNQLIFLLPNTIPFLLTGQEFGALNRPSIHERAGVCDKGYKLLSEDGISLRDGIEFEGNIFARGEDKRKSCFDFYRELVQLRLNSPILQKGDIHFNDPQESVEGSAQTIISFTRTYHGRSCVCSINLGHEARQIGNLNLLRGHKLYGVLDEGNILSPFQGIVIEA